MLVIACDNKAKWQQKSQKANSAVALVWGAD
jgi:hypothetical protein